MIQAYRHTGIQAYRHTVIRCTVTTALMRWWMADGVGGEGGEPALLALAPCKVRDSLPTGRVRKLIKSVAPDWIFRTGYSDWIDN